MVIVRVCNHCIHVQHPDAVESNDAGVHDSALHSPGIDSSRDTVKQRVHHVYGTGCAEGVF